jgi:uncharacterized membrane protein YhaH (DUF805 family)
LGFDRDIPLSLAALIAVKRWSVMPIAFAGSRSVLVLYLLVFFADLSSSFTGLAVAIKRLHDRNKSASWLLVPSILLTIAYYTGAVEVRLIFGLVPGPSCYDYCRHGSEGTLVA